MAKGNPKHQPGEILTIKQFVNLFCEKFELGRSTFYKEYRDLIKFQDIGARKKRLRIPYRIAMGIIHMLSGQYDAKNDPPVEELTPYLKGNPQSIEI